MKPRKRYVPSEGFFMLFMVSSLSHGTVLRNPNGQLASSAAQDVQPLDVSAFLSSPFLLNKRDAQTPPVTVAPPQAVARVVVPVEEPLITEIPSLVGHKRTLENRSFNNHLRQQSNIPEQSLSVAIPTQSSSSTLPMTTGSTTSPGAPAAPTKANDAMKKGRHWNMELIGAVIVAVTCI